MSELGEVSNMANDTRSASQRGEGKIGSIISLVLLLGFCYALWNVAPVYFADYQLGDKMIEVCRLHPAQANEEKIRDLLMLSVRENNLSQYINKPDFKIQARDNARHISVAYERQAKVLPGWERTFKFSHDVDQPFF
jgi:hypothetical protein